MNALPKCFMITEPDLCSCDDCGDIWVKGEGHDCIYNGPDEGPDETVDADADYEEWKNCVVVGNEVNMWHKHNTYENDTALAVLLVIYGDKARMEIDNYFKNLPF